MLWQLRFKEAILVSFMMLCLILVSSYNEGSGVLSSSSRNPVKDRDDDTVEHPMSWISQLCPFYKETPEEVPLQEEFLPLRWKHPENDTIYFTQTSCKKFLSSREACAIESASKHHPRRSVRVFMTASSVDKRNPLMKVLLSLPTVEFSWLDLDMLFKDGPLSEWHQERLWMYNQRKSFTFIRDAARASLLRRFGGTNIDLESITLRPLPNVTNWLVRINDDQVTMDGASFMPEHPFLQMILYAIPQVFDPLESDAIGPTLVTESLYVLCPSIEDFTDLNTTEYCGDMTIFPINAFYPMSYNKEELLTMNTVRKGLGSKFFREHGDAYTLHLFNSLSNYGKIEMGLDSILEEVARRNCPMIYDAIIKHNLIL